MNSNNFIPLCVLILLSIIGCKSDNEIADIKVASNINNLEFSANDNTDLEPILNSILGKKYIGLAEADHGGSKAYKFRSRLVKYLHQEGASNVLAMESGLYDGLRLWQRVKDKEVTNIRDALLYSFMFMYVETPEIYPLYRYIEDNAFNDSPLVLVGFDGRHSSDPACELMIGELQVFIENNQLTTVNWARFLYAGQGTMCPWSYPELTQEEKNFYASTLQQLNVVTSQMKATQPLPSIEDRDDFRTYATFWLQVIKSMQAQYEERWYGDHNPDEIMQADNLYWLANEWLPKENIMAWGHNIHVGRLENTWGQLGTKAAFSHLEVMQPNKTYSLLHVFNTATLTSFDADPEKRKITYFVDSRPNSVERVLAGLGVEDAFILPSEISSLDTSFSINGYSVENIEDMADGIFFTRHETPSSIDSPR
ncbi:erythromycin esterase family protein [Vibrio cionasavignyae]|uniref:erythromycin esterase family protein n=1 Tax=Vibrio cionasavignyae TaxID=2910252 RepID=UPI003D0C09F5